ncbi:DNA-processing protein DprA [Cellulomonas composti]|uniref:DNA processing protein DprA n=1 Tax=Cellulomonas composti TaxID=266130 RepID=A0A511J9C1_9CELL|nr:DNA-processing protein DprA [Cellulomonas composti]GEL94359.1 DNA processing protein DprA [Cellulomonas composti]
MEQVVADERTARAAWSGLVEPGDDVAGTLIATLGASDAWNRLTAAVRGGLDDDGVVAGVRALLPDASAGAAARLERAVRRWAPRLGRPAPTGATGVRVVVPGDDDWPAGLDDLGPCAPPCLWVRGEVRAVRGTVAIVGSRAATTYGERVAYDLAAGAADAGLLVVSGGAYGIDAAVHRGAHARPGGTLVVLAGGVDRSYPSGNASLFEAVLSAGGALVSEVPPGALPTRSRFLQRNRLIAAIGAACVVVEAAWRSGALSTAHHAERLLRPVGAVPGPVTSMASAGCHRLLREGVAVCVTDGAEVVELAGAIGPDAVPAVEDVRRPTDGLDEVGRRVLDALGTRVARSSQDVAQAAGLGVAETLGAFGLLELEGLAEREGKGWRRSSKMT